MRAYSLRQKLVCLTLVSLMLGAVIVAAPSQRALRFSRVALSANDLAATYGLNIYKFALRANGAQRYRIILREKRAPDQPWKSLLAEEIGAADAPEATLTVSFTRQDGRFGGVFHDQEFADFKVKLCDDRRCYAGMGATVPVPLADCEGVILFVHDSEAEVPENGRGSVRLLTMKPSSRLAAQSGDAQYPRAELLLETASTP